MIIQPDYKIFSNCLTCDDRSCASQALSVSELELLSKNCNEAKFEQGETILAEGSRTSNIIYLREGLVKEYGKKRLQEEYILQVIKPHSYLGLHSIFSDNNNHYSYAALTPVRVCYIDLNVFTQFIKENGRFGYKILSSVCNDSLNNYHRFIDKHQKKIYGKLADAILYFALVIFGKNEFDLPLSRKELAYLIGMSRESVSKQISVFVQDKIISVDGRNIKILDMIRLKNISKMG
ncbi:Crp/Fnr family transcriptional regulator [Marinifilum sp. D714]|uniref:Crp/Fnr family transcriptional regulator n=1 Tax=Marinifilum sp. D714 TaxID=2937523 RepID=UPI0027BF001D|nr:Crp/Fnr family transcriptional regulator [Marinifilum sp. D714]MDQ2179093.1 Crp/Fnr family transcriptional regulator [Marinifilum sp. D714]